MKRFHNWCALELNVSEGSFIANLTTVGRKTGKEHTIPLRLILYNGRFYASRRNAEGDWLKNVLKNPHVVVEVYGRKIRCGATIVKDAELSRKISSLKYADERAATNRMIVEITPLD